MNIGMIGVAFVLGLSAIGSAIGAGIAGQAAIGTWKRNYLQNKPASFLLVAFAGAPLTQTIYGFILMSRMLQSSADPFLLLGAGFASGLGMGMSAIAQGRASASSCDAFGET
ncbi:MAG: V-type ATP synthase subunit K, partial [Treponema sp. GWA1_62_8]